MKRVELNRNEQLYGPSPKCLEVLKNFNPEHAYRYLDGYSNSDLRKRLSLELNFPENQIIIGYGVEDILRTIFNGLAKADSLLTANPTYTYYKKYLENQKGRIYTFDLKIINSEFEYEVSSILNAYDQYKPKVLLLTSPNNPTGNVVTANQLEEILKYVDENTLVVVDEAYWGFNLSYDQNAFLSLVSKYSNLVILRSFSKIYGLAGLRIGFGLVGSEAPNLMCWQNQYLGFSRILEEVAIAALDSKEYSADIANKIITDREWFIKEVSANENLKVFISKSNFVLIGFHEKDQTKIEEILEKEESPIGKIYDKGLLRVTIGLTPQVKHFAEILKKI